MAQKNDPKVGTTMWVSCRAHPDCEGRQTKVLAIRKVPPVQGGGRVLALRCQTCKRRFQIRF